MEWERKSPLSLSEVEVMLVREVDFITVGTGRECRDNIEPEPELGRSEDDPSLSLQILREMLNREMVIRHSAITLSLTTES